MRVGVWRFELLFRGLLAVLLSHIVDLGKCEVVLFRSNCCRSLMALVDSHGLYCLAARIDMQIDQGLVFQGTEDDPSQCKTLL